MNAEGEWWVDGDGAVSGACERKGVGGGGRGRTSTTQRTFASSMCGDGKLDTVEEYGRGSKRAWVNNPKAV